ncbi:type IV toxin-antitoxin system AbiEi family antitoxin domain-containing protein [Rhodococcus triatomae]|uniref:Transcriptional regulator, AbiEi antitoxin, Type IV TA system n=1 Tax=Rhodococcus triatomae TaxID=300028 RepID=A0A1G7ZYM8_9NOCA|nr:type IV toxin-antitoxin system AbiEi family antitoxin domain-containing protein [Rhodococcus triatomae]QNG17909.1 type IV toxin-antitoxin system AbiEi family antitoxin domain-containing protein [Rhodococcus triatomae]QNG22423.1 type IV toxin-antitoxin system AbiEi family antitoxin domain-containing protein [Rhodococcus triatomae]SDH13721.1 Transcriptional regulator, AbiEi antitoxin, Type IV TA system [Rhodococcus triatomae]
MDHLPEGIIGRGDAIARGFTDRELRAARTHGELVCLRRGHYLRAADHRELDEIGRHRVLARATWESSTNTVVSHVSAAAFHGVDLWNVPLDTVHLTVDRRGGGRRHPTRHVHATPIRENEIVHIDGVAVTSIERTIVDLARTLPFEEATVIGDSALRLELTDRSRIQDTLKHARSRTGVHRAARTLQFLDGLSESVGESRSRVALDRMGYPAPRLQVPIVGTDSHVVARVDFLWEEEHVIGEFDGMAKYSMSPGISEQEAFRREKLREDELRALGFIVARWTWGHLATPDTIRTRLGYAFAAARGSA